MFESEDANPEDIFGPLNGEHRGTQVALVSTKEPLDLRIDELDDHRIPEGMVCMGSFLEGRLIARCAVPPDWLESIENRNLFGSPVRIALAAVEQDPGLQCRLFALIPVDDIETEDDEEPEEPWAASVPRFEEEEARETEVQGEAYQPILLGNRVRLTKDRRHPDSLAAEAADILQSILTEDENLSSVVDKLLEDL